MLPWPARAETWCGRGAFPSPPGRDIDSTGTIISIYYIYVLPTVNLKKKQSWKRKQGWKWRLYTNILSHFYLSFVFGLYFVNSKSDYILNTEWHDLFDDQRLKTNMWNVVLFFDFFLSFFFFLFKSSLEYKETNCLCGQWNKIRRLASLNAWWKLCIKDSVLQAAVFTEIYHQSESD